MENLKLALFTSIFLVLIASCKQATLHTEKYSLDTVANQRMGYILDSIAKQNLDKDNPFSPEAQLLFFNGQFTNVANDTYRSMTLKFYKANILLKVGQEKEAVLEFENLLKVKELAANPANYLKTWQGLALANLRLGERTNCITSHCGESCVFPLMGMGVHMDKTGSRKAIEIYEAILKKYPQDLDSRWLLNIAYMTLGEYPDKVPASFLIAGLDKDTSGVTVKPFVDVAADLKLDTKNKAGGAIVDDFNNDGYLDIVTSDMGLDGAMHYFQSNPNNNGFIDVTKQSGLASFRGGLNMVQADYNNDGFTDILVLRGAWLMGKFGKQPKSLLRNNGDGTFTDVTIQSGLLTFHPTNSAVWKDFNNDGWLDLFIGNESTDPNDAQPCQLFLSNRDGTFKEVAEQAGCNFVGFVKAVGSGDYNNDGWQDIVLSTCDGRRILLKNTGEKDGMPHFEDVTTAAGLANEHMSTFPTWFWDFDNDGWPDIFVCGYQNDKSIAYTTAAEALHVPTNSSVMYLYRNNHDGTFTDVSPQVGLNKAVFGMGANFGDIDNDGWLDMYIGTGNPEYGSLVPNKLYKNIGGQRFADVTTSARVGNLQKGHGVSFADIDNDGNQDIFEETGGAYNGDAYYNSLFMNPGQGTNNWINLLLEGTKSNRSAIGARLEISFKENGKGRTVYRDVNSGGSFGCSPLRREIGIGQATIIDQIKIKWPSGNMQTFTNVKPCQFLKIKEGNDNLVTINLKRLDFKANHKDAIGCKPLVVLNK